jgi:hypothetical protein
MQGRCKKLLHKNSRTSPLWLALRRADFNIYHGANGMSRRSTSEIGHLASRLALVSSPSEMRGTTRREFNAG